MYATVIWESYMYMYSAGRYISMEMSSHVSTKRKMTLGLSGGFILIIVDIAQP